MQPIMSALTDTEAGDKIESEILSVFRRVPNLNLPSKFADTRSASSSDVIHYVTPQPCDLIVTVKGGATLYLEVKASRVHSSLYDGIANVRKIQAASARRIHKLGGIYLFIFVDRANHIIKAYSGNDIAQYYFKNTDNKPEPLTMMSWSGRLEFINNLIETYQKG
jgi:hypothetical protein